MANHVAARMPNSNALEFALTRTSRPISNALELRLCELRHRPGGVRLRRPARYHWYLGPEDNPPGRLQREQSKAGTPGLRRIWSLENLIQRQERSDCHLHELCGPFSKREDELMLIQT